MIKPTIHLNGTSREDLLEQLNSVWASLYDARTALQHAQPNGRDYYPQGANVIQEALREHGERIGRVTALMHEIDELREHVAG